MDKPLVIVEAGLEEHCGFFENQPEYCSCEHIIGLVLAKAILTESVTAVVSIATLHKNFLLISEILAPFRYNSKGHSHLNINFVCFYECQENLSIVRYLKSVLGIHVWISAFQEEFKDFLGAAQLCNSPVFIFQSKFSTSLPQKFSQQSGVCRKIGKDVTLVSTGPGIPLLLELQDDFLAHKIDPEIIDSTCHPFDPILIIQSLYKTNALVIIDLINTGLAENMALSVLEKVDYKRRIPFLSLVLPSFSVENKQDTKNCVLQKIQFTVQRKSGMSCTGEGSLKYIQTLGS